uniref:Uncharacterized protein n=1 Tax=Cannabis sativa TaxID=3483 RepID=A0A803PBC6_CANSA
MVAGFYEKGAAMIVPLGLAFSGSNLPILKPKPLFSSPNSTAVRVETEEHALDHSNNQFTKLKSSVVDIRHVIKDDVVSDSDPKRNRFKKTASSGQKSLLNNGSNLGDLTRYLNPSHEYWWPRNGGPTSAVGEDVESMFSVETVEPSLAKPEPNPRGELRLELSLGFA